LAETGLKRTRMKFVAPAAEEESEPEKSAALEQTEEQQVGAENAAPE
jgi:hypothetical protein